MINSVPKYRAIRARLFPGCFQVVVSRCWKRHGFATLPKSSRTGSNAMSARDCLSALPCWDKASKMIDAGHMPGKVAAFIREQNGDGQEYTLLTLKKYIQLYRRHFVSPAAALKGTVERLKGNVEAPSARELKGDVRNSERKTKAENKKDAARKKRCNSIAGDSARDSQSGGGDSGAAPPGGGGGDSEDGRALSMQTLDKLAAFQSGVNEVVLMEQVVLLQFERVKSQRELERTLGFPLPNLWREIEQITKLGGTLVNLKADLGLDGYLRVPRMIHGKLTHDMVPRMLAGLSDRDRKAVAEFGQTLTELIRQSDGSFAEDPEE